MASPQDDITPEVSVTHANDAPLDAAPGTPPRSAYRQVQDAEHFVELRRRFRRFAFPATLFFLVWYFLYVLLAAYAPGFMSTKVVGNINIGLLMGFGQFVTTFGLTIAYVRWAARTFDPLADRIRDEMHLEGGQR